MTAHCRPDIDSASDMEIAAELVAIAIDPAIPYTRSIKLVAERLAEIRTRETEIAA